MSFFRFLSPRTRRATLLGALTVATALLAGCAKDAAPESKFVLLDGSTRTTQDLRGKVTLVNFWATSCTTCVAEMPQIVATHDKYKAKGYDTLAVAMQYDPPSYVVNFAETRKLPFKVALDNTGNLASLGRRENDAHLVSGRQTGPDRQEIRGPARLCRAAQADRKAAGRGVTPP